MKFIGINLILWFLPIATWQYDFLDNYSKSNKVDNNSISIEPQYEECDNIKYIPQASKPDFRTMLAGVKYAVVTNVPRDINTHSSVFRALIEYLNAMEFEFVEFMDDDYLKSFHYCEEIWVNLHFTYSSYTYKNIEWHFESPCNENYRWILKTDKIVKVSQYQNTQTSFYNVIREMHPYQKPDFNVKYRLELPKKMTCWTEDKIKTHIRVNGCDKIEGIYESLTSSEDMPKYKVAIRKINGIYYLIYLSGAENANWTEGEIKATLEPTATPLFFKAHWIMSDKTVSENFYLSFEKGLFNLLTEIKERHLYIKMFPSASEEINNNPSEIVSSGTGYAISSAGHIATNYHVINGANSIRIRGINGDFSKSYKATVLIDDKNNDLSIIKITDPSFTTLGTLPYIISGRSTEVGSNIFVLGYPLRATMGDEVKLTNGIISSKSGFQGDITSYQISAPVQPGNSGGPLFDDRGNVIGTINAKHAGAESVSYAVKNSYLLNLIESMQSPPKLQTINSVTGKPLTEQVKILKKYTYIIEIN